MERVKEAQNANRVGPRCGISLAMAEMSEDDAEELQEALDGPWTGTAISRVLKDMGFQVSDQTVQRHRKGDCTCGRV